jgi:hypothetical protein
MFFPQMQLIDEFSDQNFTLRQFRIISEGLVRQGANPPILRLQVCM